LAIKRKSNKEIYPELNNFLENLNKVETLEKLYIIGYATDYLCLDNLPHLNVLKVSIVKELTLNNLPVTLQKLEIEPCKNNIFALKGTLLTLEIEKELEKELELCRNNIYTSKEEGAKKFFTPIDNKFVNITINNFIKIGTTGKIIPFNVSIPKIPFGLEIIKRKPFELIDKYSKE
jgi:hypothetical protein